MDIFRNSTKEVPKSDRQIIRVDMETQEIGGRKSALPAQSKSEAMTISHVQSAGNGK
jgi:hypothetical protein